MANRPWRTSLGLVAVLLWSAVIGLPLLLFHLNRVGMGFGEHLHAAVLFVASQALVYWLTARPTKHSPKTAAVRVLERATSFATIPAQHQIWDAELVAPTATSASASMGTIQPATIHPATIDPAATFDRCIAKLIVTNYLGSSRSRIIYVEPAGTNCTLLPGQELEIAATAQSGPLSFRIVESDLATQVYVDGGRIAVAKAQHQADDPGRLHEEAANDEGHQP